MQGNNGQYPDSHRHILKGLLSLITLSQKVKNLFDYQTPGVNGFSLKLKQIHCSLPTPKHVNSSISNIFLSDHRIQTLSRGLRTSS